MTNARNHVNILNCLDDTVLSIFFPEHFQHWQKNIDIFYKTNKDKCTWHTYDYCKGQKVRVKKYKTKKILKGLVFFVNFVNQQEKIVKIGRNKANVLEKNWYITYSKK